MCTYLTFSTKREEAERISAMKKKRQGSGCFDQAKIFSQQRLRGRDVRHKATSRLTFLRVTIGILALVLLGIATFSSLTGAKNAYACGILFPCQTPTPSPTMVPSPTPTPRPTPTLMPTPTAAPSPTAIPSPTATAPGITPTASISPTSVPAAVGGNSGSQPPDQGAGGSLFPLIGLGMLIPLVILLGLGIGWLILRRAFLPQARTKLPPSGARPWSRTHVPSPDSLAGNTVMTGNVGGFIPLPKNPPLSDASIAFPPSGTLPTMSDTPGNLLSTGDYLSLLPDAGATSTQNIVPKGGARYWKWKEGDSSSPDNLSSSVQGGSLHGFTRYWRKQEDGASPLFEKGLLSNAPYYTKVPKDK
jgi:hypothetical protein